MFHFGLGAKQAWKPVSGQFPRLRRRQVSKLRSLFVSMLHRCYMVSHTVVICSDNVTVCCRFVLRDPAGHRFFGLDPAGLAMHFSVQISTLLVALLQMKYRWYRRKGWMQKDAKSLEMTGRNDCWKMLSNEFCSFCKVATYFAHTFYT